MRGVEQLAAPERERFLARLGAIDWNELRHDAGVDAGQLSESRVIDLAERAKRHAELQRVGVAAYAAGKVAVLMVAGGQGTRLGSSAPKGCVSAAPHSGKSIYQLQAEKVLSLSRRLNRDVPFVIMTSPMTDAETRDFFAAHAFFGLKREQVTFFSQGTVPSLDQQGRALLREPGQLLENPDGHGGCFTALVKSGTLARLRDAGIGIIVYIQVDNILAPVDDPILVGTLVAEKADVVTKVLTRLPDEKVGVLLRGADGRDRIIEYTELGAYREHMQSPAGQKIYRWGSPAMHAWSVPFLTKLAERGYQPPLHRSAKPLKAWIDGSAQEVKGWKNERFIFDLIPQAPTSVGLEIDRAAEFAPIKNATGVDSLESAVKLASDQYADWLRSTGVKLSLPDKARIEISPLFAATKEQFLTRWDKRVGEISGDYYLEA